MITHFFRTIINEALHTPEKERKIVFDYFDEIEERLDKHSKKLIANNIELFLDYSIPFLRPSIYNSGNKLSFSFSYPRRRADGVLRKMPFGTETL